MNTFVHVPPGFRFHPTDEELVDYYLRRKVASMPIDLDVIKDIDLYKIEPWDLQELCKMGAAEQNDWYFFSHKDKKYPTGTRTNRATGAGFWKATGRDKAIHSKNSLIGMRKTLVFYKGRAPNGHKSDWIMHEYRLETNENGPPQEEGWVVCRVFKKRMTAVMGKGEHDMTFWDSTKDPFSPDIEYSPSTTMASNQHYPYRQHYSISQEQQDTFSQNSLLKTHHTYPDKQQDHYCTGGTSNTMVPIPYCVSDIQEEYFSPGYHQPETASSCYGCGGNMYGEMSPDLITDWRVLDKFVASQLSHGDASNNIGYSNSQIYNLSDEEHAILGDDKRNARVSPDGFS